MRFVIALLTPVCIYTPEDFGHEDIPHMVHSYTVSRFESAENLIGQQVIIASDGCQGNLRQASK